MRKEGRCILDAKKERQCVGRVSGTAFPEELDKRTPKSFTLLCKKEAICLIKVNKYMQQNLS